MNAEPDPHRCTEDCKVEHCRECKQVDHLEYCPVCETGKQCQQVETSDPSFVKLRCLTCNTHFRVFFKPIH